MYLLGKNYFILTLITFFFTTFSFNLSAQNELLEASIDEPTFFKDISILIPSEVEKNIFYVDLELLEGHLSDLQIINLDGDIVLNSSLKDIPQDALYELDLSHIEKGHYQFQIRTYKDEIKKDIILE